MKCFLASLLGLGLLSGAAALAGTVQVDPAIPAYTPVSGVSGTIKSVGSDTMNNLMTLWSEGFRTYYPNILPEIEGKGSATAPAALIAGTATFGPMSREMKAAESDEFEKKFGYKPTGLPTGIDMLAVIVHKDNPLASLSLLQVDAIFSKARKGGFGNDIKTWGDLGLTGEWAAAPISLYGRNSASGTYGYFKEHALFKGDFKDTVKEQPGTSSVVQAVASDRFGIGYGGIGYVTADVRALPLSKDGKAAPVAAIVENAYSGDYPLSRFLLVYVNAKPGSALDPLRREFIRFIFSKQGQEVVIKDGYFPVPATVASDALASVGITAGQ
ncbi:MAG: PstS family phosphate ABC transporter substrate-binding protein [Planctomycetia bacterium]